MPTRRYRGEVVAPLPKYLAVAAIGVPLKIIVDELSDGPVLRMAGEESRPVAAIHRGGNE
jgi:hypothetical protein